MKKRAFWLAILLSLVVMILLAACSAAQPTEAPAALPTQAAAGTTPYPLPESAETTAAYPAPEGNTTPDAYPVPEENTMPAPGETAYPGPGQGGAQAGAVEVATIVAATQAALPTQPVNTEMDATDPATVQLASGKVQLVEFFAFWDGTSKALAPVINELKDAYGDRMNFVFLDIDDPANQKFKEQLGYKMQPHFFLLDKQGNILRDWQGYVDIVDLRSTFEGALQ